MTETLVLDFTVQPDTLNALAMAGIPYKVVTTLSDVVVIQVEAWGWQNADAVQVDLREQTGDDSILLVIDVEEIVAPTYSGGFLVPYGTNGLVGIEDGTALVGLRVRPDEGPMAGVLLRITSAAHRDRGDLTPAGVWLTWEGVE